MKSTAESRDIKALKMLLKNEEGNCRALLRHVIKLEKKQGTFRREDWEEWCRQYRVKEGVLKEMSE